MTQDEVRALKEQITLLQAQLLTQQEMLEVEARRRIDLEVILEQFQTKP